jgi:hypothetical protein
MKRIRFIENSGNLPKEVVDKYQYQPMSQFIEMFLPQDSSYCVVPQREEADICMYTIQHTDDSLLRDNELNIFFCIENLRKNGRRGGMYAYYNKFGAYGSRKTDVFIMNDESKEVRQHDRTIIPVIHCRLSYYNRVQNDFAHLMTTRFEDKKFALFVSQSVLNKNKRPLFDMMSQYGTVDHIKMFPELERVTCYNSVELLKLFNQYKFIITCENSHTTGYITEKIFNVFLSKSIAIYDGAPDIHEFIKPKCFIPLSPNLGRDITTIKDNKELYNRIVCNDKIQERYKDITITY